MQLAAAVWTLSLASTSQVEFQNDEDAAASQIAPFSVVSERLHLPKRSDARGSLHVTCGQTVTDTGGDSRAMVVAHDGSGVELWARFDPIPTSKADYVWLPDEGDGIFVTLTYSTSFGVAEPTFAGRVQRLSDAGDIEWTTDIVQAAVSSFSLLLAGSSDGSALFATGNDSSLGTPQTGSRGIVSSLAPETGLTRWSHFLPNTTHASQICCDALGQQVFVVADSTVGWIYPRLIALDGATGAERWTLGLGPAGPASVGGLGCSSDGGTIYLVGPKAGLATDLLSVLAVRSDDGSVLWSRQLAGDQQTGYYLGPVDQLFVDEPRHQIVLTAFESTGLGDLLALGLSEADGSLNWSTALQGAQTYYKFRASLDPSSGTLLVAKDAISGVFGYPVFTELSAIDAASGALIGVEEYPVEPPFDGSEVGELAWLEVHGESVAVLSRTAEWETGGGLLELRLLPTSGGAAPVVAASQFYAEVPRGIDVADTQEGSALFAMAMGTKASYSLLAVDAASGDMLWQQALQLEASIPDSNWDRDYLIAEPDGSRVYAMRVDWPYSSSAHIDGFDGQTGELLWSKELKFNDLVDDWVLAHPPSTSVDGLLVLIRAEEHGSTAGSSPGEAVEALRTHNGATKWLKKIPSQYLETGWKCGAVALSPDHSLAYILYSLNNLFIVVAHDVETGEAQWNAAPPMILFEPDSLSSVDDPVDLAVAADGEDLLLLGRGTSEAGSGYYLGRVAMPDLPSIFGELIPIWGVQLEVDAAPPSTFDSGMGRLWVCPSSEQVLVVRSVDALESFINVTRIDARSPLDGSLLWRTEFGPPHSEQELQSVALSEDGRTMVLALRDAEGGPVELVGIDTSCGVELWRLAVTAGVEENHVVGLCPTADGFACLLGAEVELESAETNLLRVTPESLVAGPSQVEVESPFDLVFQLSRPTTSSGHTYWLVGSSTGTSPGIPLAGLTVPLVLDAYTIATIVLANQGPFETTLGTLDAEGKAFARIESAAPLDPSLTGTSLHHAFVELDGVGAVLYVSEAVQTVLLEDAP